MVAVASAGAIVGGSAVSIRRVPWTVFIQDASATASTFCTGSILDATHILTAAHCLYGETGSLAQPVDLTVEAGVSNTITPLPTDAAQNVEVRAFRIHPGYVWRSTDDDVAILTLSSPLKLNGPDARPVRLPPAGITLPLGTRATLAGYGSQEEGLPPDGRLESMSATIDPQALCDPSSGGITLCARAPHASTCNGDSGAALMTTGPTPTLIGLVSIGSVACTPGSHTLFTYVGAAAIRRFILASAPDATGAAAGTAR